MATSTQLRQQILAGQWDETLGALYGSAPAVLARQRQRDAAALEQRFGTPQQMAFSYVDEMPTADLLAELHIRRRLVAVTVITLAAALAVYIAVLVWQAYLVYDRFNGWTETYVVEYENIVTGEDEQ